MLYQYASALVISIQLTRMPDQNSSSQEQYIVTARKWRPQRFADVVGQEHVSRTLRNAVESKRIHHAYIFNGPRGVGKTTTARILAKAVNCENPSADFEPCNVCSSCQDINTGRSMDVIEIDGASNNSVDDIRKLRENVKYPPVKGAYKMYIIDEIHMLSTSAFNALLKTLEEPPRHLLFVFATTEPHKVPATILSRCQRFDFRRMQIDEIAAQLRHISTQEGITIDDESLAVIGKKGDGSMRDSQSIFDQVIAFCGKNVEYTRVNEALNLIDTEFYFTLGRAIREGDVATILNIAREVFMRGYDLQECLHGLAEHFRNLLTVLATQNAQLIEASKLHREQYLSEAAQFSQADILQYMTTIMNTEQQLRFAPQPKLRFEFALVQMAKMDSAVLISELLAELAELKKKLPQLSENSHLPLVIGHLSDDVSAQPMTNDQVTNDERSHSSLAIGHLSNDTTTRLMTNYQVTNDQIPKPQTPKQPRTVSANELEASWKGIIDTNEQLDGAVKTYLQTAEMLEVRCKTDEMVISCDKEFVADRLLEKKHQLADILNQELGGAITITVLGGTSNKAVSMFNDFAADTETLNQRLSTTSIDTEAEAPHEVNNSEAFTNITQEALASPKLQAPSTKPQASTELHELDRTIIELFGAVAVPLRQ
jgi:DNA polymerase-3 subunit gamma/tau